MYNLVWQSVICRPGKLLILLVRKNQMLPKRHPDHLSCPRASFAASLLDSGRSPDSTRNKQVVPPAALATPLQRGQAGYAIRSPGKYDKVAARDLICSDLPKVLRLFRSEQPKKN
jgi:hypothetical protein